MTPEAKIYLDEALAYIQDNSVKREYIDWPMLRQEVWALATHAQTPAETYPAIQRALELLDDHHSIFNDPTKSWFRLHGQSKYVGLRAVYPEGSIGVVYPGSPAEAAGLQVGEIITLINGHPLTALTIHQFRDALNGERLDLQVQSREQTVSRFVSLSAAFYPLARKPQGWRLEHNIGYVHLPELLGAPDLSKPYAEAAQKLIRDLDERAISGWVIDLRGNYGGNMWPMLVGVGPILGEGECVSFVTPEKKITAFYRNGQAILEPSEVAAEVEKPYQVKRPWPPVAVLTSQITASAAEFVALAFCGRPRTQSFGEPTHGLPTGNDSKMLSDGAMIFLTAALGVDRTGRMYDSALLPDHEIKIDWTQVGTGDDPVLQAAIQWLHTEEGCM